jgi:hypothetical protein
MTRETLILVVVRIGDCGLTALSALLLLCLLLPKAEGFLYHPGVVQHKTVQQQQQQTSGSALRVASAPVVRAESIRHTVFHFRRSLSTLLYFVLLCLLRILISIQYQKWEVFVDQSKSALDKGAGATLDAFLGLAPANQVKVIPAVITKTKAKGPAVRCISTNSSFDVGNIDSVDKVFRILNKHMHVKVCNIQYSTRNSVRGISINAILGHTHVSEYSR